VSRSKRGVVASFNASIPGVRVVGEAAGLALALLMIVLNGGFMVIRISGSSLYFIVCGGAMVFVLLVCVYVYSSVCLLKEEHESKEGKKQEVFK
jgi:uncharacterized membrane protein